MNPSYSGKVRDIYDLGDSLILCSSDRISAFDVVFEEKIPDKGKILNKISNLWFQYFSEIPNHILETKIENFPKEFQTPEFAERSVLVKKCKRIDIECVVRGYLAGSSYKEYKTTGRIAEKTFPAGLKESSPFSEPIFTPAIKNEVGHDENISEEKMLQIVGKEVFDYLKQTSLYIYEKAQKKLKEVGIILCDTKFEFGWHEDKILLIDELLTPDSSRYWEEESCKEGTTPPSMDKQILRNYLETLNWNKTPPPPKLPQEIIEKIIDKYKELERKLELCLLGK